jgi:hypothetical protein
VSAGVKDPAGPIGVNHEHVWTRKDLTTQLGQTWDIDALEALLVDRGGLHRDRRGARATQRTNRAGLAEVHRCPGSRLGTG